MKKKICILLVTIMLVTTFFFADNMLSFAATSGTCGATGSTIKWSYNATTTTLTLTGSGTTKDYGTTALNRPGWYDYKSEITRVVVGEGITTLGYLNFYGFTVLTDVSLPSTLTTIRGGTANYGAFRECTALKSIQLPSTLQEIGAMAFRGCSQLQSITIPNSVTTLGTAAFRDCTRLTSAVYGTGLTETGLEAFYESGLRDVVLPSNITTISAYSFYGTKMTSINIPDNITSIGTRAFANCTFLSNVTVNNSNTTFEGIIGEDPFNSCSESLTFYGHSKSTTQTYANEKNYNFVSLDPCEHEVTRNETVKYPTCEETGISQMVCDECGFVVSESSIPAVGHIWTLSEELDETEENGHITRTYSCENCDSEKAEIEHIANVEGFYTYSNTATCTRPGLETYTCTLEGCGKVTRNISQAGNHQIENPQIILAATCTEKGTQQGVCSVCNENIVTDIPALGHQNVFIDEFDNTEEDGHSYVIYECSVCEEQTLEPTHIEWVEGNYKSTVITPARCTINGLQRDACDICGQSRNVTLPANGQHEWYVTTQTEPTCTAVGKIYYACENCEMTKSENIDALGHDYVLQEASSQDATCTTAGYDTYKCQRCGGINREVINAKGHTIDEDNYTVITEADCLNDGRAASVCTVCGSDFEIKLDKLGHDMIDNEEPIEDKPGHVMSTPICDRCGYTDKATMVHKEWLDGLYTRTVISSPTCTMPYTSRDVCTICGTSRVNNVPAPGHSYSYDHYDEQGKLYYTCSVCHNEASYNASYVSALFITYINTNTSDRALGYIFDVRNDGFVNAKDYALINRVIKLTTPEPEAPEAPEGPQTDN